jgi:hypothetical protein
VIAVADHTVRNERGLDQAAGHRSEWPGLAVTCLHLRSTRRRDFVVMPNGAVGLAHAADRTKLSRLWAHFGPEAPTTTTTRRRL